MNIGFYVKYPFFLSNFNETLTLSTVFSKNTPISKFMKIRSVGPGRTDRCDEANIRFFQFCERALKKNVFLSNYVPVCNIRGHQI